MPAFVFDYARTRGVLDDFFAHVGYDEIRVTGYPLGRAVLQRLRAVDAGLQYVRSHNLFTGPAGDLRGRVDAGCDVVSRGPDGRLQYDWTHVDRVFDAWLAAGFRPYVELGFMPPALARVPPGTKHLWKYPPADFREWQALVEAAATHLRERYPGQVADFIWEVWNEPNPLLGLKLGYFKGSFADYARLYDHAVAGLWAAFPAGNFTVGGPALANRQLRFLRKFLHHCLHGRNHASGETGTKLDFVSFHLKGGLYFQTPKMRKFAKNLHRHLRLIRQFMPGGKRADSNSERAAGVSEGGRVLPPDIPIHVTELDPVVGCAIGWERKAHLQFRDTEYYPAFVGRVATLFQELRTAHGYHLAMVFSDNLHFADEVGRLFKGCRSLTTAPAGAGTRLEEGWGETRVLTKPVVKAYQVLHRLRGAVVTRVSPAAVVEEDISVLVTRPSMGPGPEPEGREGAGNGAGSDGRGTPGHEFRALVTHFNPDYAHARERKVVLHLRHLPAPTAAARVTFYCIDRAHNNTFRAWETMGRPDPPSDDQWAALRALDLLRVTGACTYPVTSGCLELPLVLPPHALAYLEGVLEPPETLETGARSST